MRSEKELATLRLCSRFLAPYQALFSRKSSALPLLAALTTLPIFACRHVEAPPSCPPGAKLMGVPPPKGAEVWCQKSVDGRPVKDGLFIVYTTGGSKMVEGVYRNGIQDGEWVLWYENGARAHPPQLITTVTGCRTDRIRAGTRTVKKRSKASTTMANARVSGPNGIRAASLAIRWFTRTGNSQNSLQFPI